MEQKFSQGVPRHPTFSVAFDRWIDFCIWILEIDGLQVPPFDRHGTGDGELQARGLDAAGWVAWLRTVVAVQADREAAENVPMQRWIDASRADEQPEPAGFTAKESEDALRLSQKLPALMWEGTRIMVEALSSLWGQYSRLETRGGMNLQRPVGGPALQDRVAPYGAVLDRLRVFIVDYPGPMAYGIAPDTVVLAVRGPRLPAKAYDNVVFSVVQHLADLVPDGSLPTRPAPSSPESRSRP